MKRLIADLLQLSRMDKGVDKLTWSDFDLNETHPPRAHRPDERY